MRTDMIQPTGTDPTTLRRAATLGLGGALITLLGGTFAQIVTASTSVSPDNWSYPFSARAHVLLSVLWALSHVLVFVGLNGIRRSGLASARRAGVAGVNLALAGTAVLALGEIASMWLANSKEDAGAAIAISSLFGIGTLLTAIGMVMFGIVVIRGQRWAGPGRWTPLAFGLVNVVQLVLGPTDLFFYGMVAYGIAASLLMVAFRGEAAPSARPA